MEPAKPIGGYFGIELMPGAGHWHQGALRFQSARAAFLALLTTGQPTRVWMPWFICDAMREPLRMRGIDCLHYAIDEALQADPKLRIGRGEWLLYPNYFGLGDAQVEGILDRFPMDQVVIDNAQAFYSAPRRCLATIYSPRKFFGVPDGGYLLTTLQVREPEQVDGGSVARCAHLLVRAASGPETGYDKFLEAEQSLELQPPRKMSALTAALLESIDYEAARARRRANFERLHAALGHSNLLDTALGDGAAPLCYPYRTRQPGLRQSLISARIFIPTYWRDVKAACRGAPSSEISLVDELLPIPCDQRYSPGDMTTILNAIERSRTAC